MLTPSLGVAWLAALGPAAYAAGPAVSTSAASGSAAGAAPAASEARLALQKAVVFHRQARDLTMRFRAEVRNADLDKKDGYVGRFLLKDSSKFRLEIPGGTFVSDGVTFWEYHAKNRQVVIRQARDMDNRPPGEVLLRFLDSEPLSLEKVMAGGKPYLKLRPDPTRAMKNLDSLAVLLDPRDYSLHSVGNRDVAGNESEYTLLSIKRNAGIKDGEFTFKAPKGVESVDMRE